MHYWTCITQYKLRALSKPSKNSLAKSKWTEADRHICALKAVCGFQKMCAATLTCSNFIYLCTCLLSPPLCRNAPATQLGTEAGHGCTRGLRVFAGLCISPAHPEIRGVSDKDKHRYVLGAASGSSLFLDPYKLCRLNILWRGVTHHQSPTDLHWFGST